MNLIFDEGPIARSYLMILMENNLLDKKILFLNSPYKPVKFFNYFRFHKYNFFALKFLKDSNVKYLIDQIQEFFSLRKNFIKDIYNYSNIFDFKNLSFLNNTNINSQLILLKLENNVNEFFLNSGKRIIKKQVLEKMKIVHFHPGYIPEIKGADSSMRSVKLHNLFGISFFELNEKIDDGYVFFREKKQYPNFKLKNKFNFSIQEKYNIWHSFVDPILRSYYLNKLLTKKIKINYEINSEIRFSQNKKFKFENNNYYSFFNNDEKKKFFEINF